MLNVKIQQHTKTLCRERATAQRTQHSIGGESGSRFHTTNHSSGSHFTWFPRKNYNKSSRHGAQEQGGERNRARVKQHVLITEACTV